MLLVLAALAGAVLYIWRQRQPAPETGPREIKVAIADSSGDITAPEGPRGENGTGPSAVVPDTLLRAPFIAPSPGFENPIAVPIGSFLDYARRMLFDPSRGLELALPADEFGRLRLVRMEPLANLRKLDSTAFREGRVIARIRSDAPLPDLSLHNGENYLWVRGQLGSAVRAEVWSTSVLTPPKVLVLSYSAGPPADAPTGKDAFWTGNEISHKILWIACGKGWCHS